MLVDPGGSEMNYVPFLVAAIVLAGGLGAAGASVFVYVDEGENGEEPTELAVKIVEDYGPGWVIHPPGSMQFQSHVTGGQGEVSYSWATQGGTILSGDPSPVIEIDEDFPGGMFTIILTVFDEEEDSATDSYTFEIGAPSSMIDPVTIVPGNEFPRDNTSPAARTPGNVGVFAFPRIDGPPPVDVSFTLAGYPFHETSYYWDFDDGFVGWTGSSTNHTFVTPGNFSVSISMRDPVVPEQIILLTSVDIIILDEEPSGEPTFARDIPQFPDHSDFFAVDIAADPIAGTAPLYVNFQVPTSPIGQTIIMWNFGDGSAPAWNANPSHIFTEPGMYNVKVTTSMPGYGRGYGEKVITVEDPDADHLLVDIMFEQVGSPLSFAFEALPSLDIPLEYDWTFTGGVHLSGREVLNTFFNYGMKSASVHAYNEELGLSANASVSFFIAEEGAPNVHFLIHHDPNDPPRKTFEPLIGSGSPPYIYSWLFGDGYHSFEANPVHYFYGEGFYLVELYVIDGNQKVGYYSEWIYISNVYRIEAG